jgi:hypothetical protein
MSGEKVTVVGLGGVPVPSGREDYVWLDSGMISVDVGDALVMVYKAIESAKDYASGMASACNNAATLWDAEVEKLDGNLDEYRAAVNDYEDKRRAKQ